MASRGVGPSGGAEAPSPFPGSVTPPPGPPVTIGVQPALERTSRTYLSAWGRRPPQGLAYVLPPFATMCGLRVVWGRSPCLPFRPKGS